jgi:hypothetical protein
MTTSSENFGQLYATMRDDDLQRLSLDVVNLLPKAREALRAEMERRHFPIAEIDWSAQPAQPPPPPAAEKTKKSNGVIDTFVVLFICNIVSVLLSQRYFRS